MGSGWSMFAGSKADPAAYTNAVAVTEQMKTATADLQKTLDKINTAVTAAATLPKALANLKDLKGRATTLQGKAPSMSPVDIEQQRGKLEAELQILMPSITSNTDMSASADRSFAANEVKARITEVKTDTYASPELKKKYSDFEILIDVSGGMTSNKMRDMLYDLDNEYTVEKYRSFIFTRMVSFSASVAFEVLYYCTLILSFLFGGIILSNMYFSEDYWAARLFYFAYGVAFFPLVLLFAIIQPPPWLAVIAPIFDRDMEPPQDPANSGGIYGFIYNILGSPLFGFNKSVAETGSRTPIRILSAILFILLALFSYIRGIGRVNTPSERKFNAQYRVAMSWAT